MSCGGTFVYTGGLVTAPVSALLADASFIDGSHAIEVTSEVLWRQYGIRGGVLGTRVFVKGIVGWSRWDTPLLVGSDFVQAGWLVPVEDADRSPETCPAFFHIAGPHSQRHELTAYVCCEHFRQLLGASACAVQEAIARAREDIARVR